MPWPVLWGLQRSQLRRFRFSRFRILSPPRLAGLALDDRPVLAALRAMAAPPVGMPQLRVQAHASQYRSKRTASPGTSPCLPPLPELFPRDAEVTKQGGQRLGPEVLGRVAMHGSPLPLAVANDELWGALAPKVRPEVPEHGHQFAVLEFRE